MPSRGVVNNPSGTNSYEPIGQTEPAHGALKRLEQTARGLPRNPALGEPRRSKRRAVKGQQAQPQMTPAPPPEPINPDAMKAEFWQYLAGQTNDPIIRELAGL